ncbi:MAG: YfhO family protein [bacterium]|nr:YfhO family protein [bacterium]
MMRRTWPILGAAGVALLFSGHLLITADPFLGSGTDIIAMEHPLHAFAAGRLAAGDLPLWNPYHLGGFPFQAGVHGYLSPSFWTAAIFEPLFEMKLSIVLHLMLAAAGAAWWARRRTTLGAAAMLAGVTFALSGFAMSHLFAGHRRLFFTAAYLPWLIGLIEIAVRQPRRGLALAGLVCGGMLLCGHYQVITIGLVGAGLFVLLEQLCASGAVRPLRRVILAAAVMAGVVVIGVLLSLVQMLTMVETLGLSQRSGGGTAFAGSYASAPINLLTLAWPQLFGNGVEATFFGSWAYWEALPYLGLVPLVLLLAAPLVLPRRDWLPAGIVALGGLILSLGLATPLFQVFVRLVPGVGLFRAAGRYVLLAALFGSLLSALVLDRWSAGLVPAVRRRLTMLWFLPVAALAFGIWMASHTGQTWQERWQPAETSSDAAGAARPVDWTQALGLAEIDAWRALVIVTVAVGLLWLGTRKRPAGWRSAALVGLAVLDLYTFGHRFLGTGDREQFAWPDELTAFLDQRQEPGLRIICDPDLFCPGRGAAAGIGQIGGYDIFLDRAYARYINRANGKNPDEYVAVVRVQSHGPLHARLGARYLLARCDDDRSVENAPVGFKGWTFAGRFGDVAVYEHPAPQPRAFVARAVEVADEETAVRRLVDSAFALTDAAMVDEPLPPTFDVQMVGDTSADQAAIVLYDPDRVELEVDTTSGGVLVLSDNWHPGWKAYVNDQPVPVVRANCVMRALPVGPGRQRVVMVFRPVSFTIGASVSGAAWLLTAGIVVWPWRRRLLATDRQPVLPASQSA